jgi:hypothetical protein
MSAQAKLAQLQKLQAAEQMASRCGLAAFPARPYRGLCPIVQSGAICLIAVFRARSGACASCTSGHRRRHQDAIMPLDENGHPKLLVYKCDWTAPRAPHCVALLLDLLEALESVNRAMYGWRRYLSTAPAEPMRRVRPPSAAASTDALVAAMGARAQPTVPVAAETPKDEVAAASAEKSRPAWWSEDWEPKLRSAREAVPAAQRPVAWETRHWPMVGADLQLPVAAEARAVGEVRRRTETSALQCFGALARANVVRLRLGKHAH